jgi:hypothetical protein
MSAVTLLTRLSCYLSGHDYSIRQSQGRMLLVCHTCGHRSEGIPLTRPTSHERRMPAATYVAPTGGVADRVATPN